jgi:beta-lactamase class A
MRQRWYFFTLAFFILSTVTLAVFLYQTLQKNNVIAAFPNGSKECVYQFLNPLRCEPRPVLQKKEYVALRNELLEFIEEEKKKGTITHVSVYFRDLQNGPTMGIEVQENFAPASLLKVPLMITYYKKAEEDPTLLKKKLKIIGGMSSLSQNIKPQQPVENGKVYEREELLQYLITQSDNTAWEALLNDIKQNFSEEDFVMTLSDLGVIDPRTKGDQYIMVGAYASIFRILYNASYLNLDMSNKALELLSQSVFKSGLVAGVPKGIKVAHKFGERKNGDEQQLHDCGVVYFLKNPYLLCVMTKGNSIQELEPIIAQVSKKVYEEVASRN